MHWTAKKKRFCTRASRQSSIRTIRRKCSAAECSNESAQSSRKPSRRKRAPLRLTSHASRYANASSASAGSEKQPKPMPIFAGSRNWHWKGDEMNRRIGETGRWRHALKAASSRRTPKRAARAKEYRLFADSPFRRFLPFLVCLLALSLAGAGFAQDEEQEDEKSNAKP